MSTPQPPETPEPGPAQPQAETPPPGATTPPPKPPTAPPVEEDRPSTWQPGLYLKLALLLVAVGWSIAFVVKNTRQIPIDFVFATASVHLIWEILLLLGVGLVGGVLLSQLYRHRRREALAKKSRKARDSGASLGRRDKAVGKSR